MVSVEIAWRASALVLICLPIFVTCRIYPLVRVIITYMLFCTTMMCWVIKHILAYLITFVNQILPSLDIWLRRFHSEGSAKLVAAEVLEFILKFRKG